MLHCHGLCVNRSFELRHCDSWTLEVNFSSPLSGIGSQSLHRALPSFDAAKAEVDPDPGHVPLLSCRTLDSPPLVMLAQGRGQWWLGVNLEPLGCLSESRFQELANFAHQPACSLLVAGHVSVSFWCEPKKLGLSTEQFGRQLCFQ